MSNISEKQKSDISCPPSAFLFRGYLMTSQEKKLKENYVKPIQNISKYQLSGKGAKQVF